MKTFIYTRHVAKTWAHTEHTVVFTCEAESLLEADALLEKATGIKAERANDIGCHWEDK